MLSFPDLSAVLKGVNSDHLEDVGDKLNFYVSVYLVLFFTIVTGSKQHFGQPISCMGPAETHAEQWSRYFHDYCYVAPKILVKDHNQLTTGITGASNSHQAKAGMAFYQWVPYLLIMHAILFYVPKACWQSGSYNYGNGLDMESFVKGTSKGQTEYGQKRRSKVTAMARFLVDTSKFRGILGGGRDSAMYAAMKWLCVLNTIGQLSFISFFVADWNMNWAVELLHHLYYERSTSETPYFPRVVFCDVDKLEVAQPLSYTFQCVLMFNFVNEKIFLLLFGWLTLLLVVNLTLAVRQTLFLVCTPFRFLIARQLLPSSCVLFRNMSSSGVQSNELISYFVHTSLGCDGIFLLEAVASHSGRIIAREIATELFQILIKKRNDVEFNSSLETLPRPKILDFNEEDLALRDDDIEKRSLVPSTLDRRFSRSTPIISAPPYHLLFTESGREKNHA